MAVINKSLLPITIYNEKLHALEALLPIPNSSLYVGISALLQNRQ